MNSFASNNSLRAQNVFFDQTPLDWLLSLIDWRKEKHLDRGFEFLQNRSLAVGCSGHDGVFERSTVRIAIPNNDGYTPLAYASDNGQTETVDLLLPDRTNTKNKLKMNKIGEFSRLSRH